MLFGREVVVLDDDMIAGDGELKGFVGDPKSFCTFFDRKQTSVEWVDNQIYGKLLAGIVKIRCQENRYKCWILYYIHTGGIIPSDDVALVGRGKVRKGKSR
ncbi:hypothetical protein [Mediterraneibacter gnavus]|uniref:hypothetical protein n=1 Tax=Mediterraneibacter gnavus TaxID=33038 RepID=UPI0004BB8E7F|nr:hypothetical protein [Mediterraneibacter gnavus]